MENSRRVRIEESINDDGSISYIPAIEINDEFRRIEKDGVVVSFDSFDDAASWVCNCG